MCGLNARPRPSWTGSPTLGLEPTAHKGGKAFYQLKGTALPCQTRNKGGKVFFSEGEDPLPRLTPGLPRQTKPNTGARRPNLGLRPRFGTAPPRVGDCVIDMASGHAVLIWVMVAPAVPALRGLASLVRSVRHRVLVREGGGAVPILPPAPWPARARFRWRSQRVADLLASNPIGLVPGVGRAVGVANEPLPVGIPVPVSTSVNPGPGRPGTSIRPPQPSGRVSRMAGGRMGFCQEQSHGWSFDQKRCGMV
ncbi:hypothetical protein M2351_002794 [Azospirillum canadense]|nr:hypothetical protein [Azospirillum canadense]MCW2238231.1 hypothetical protein [Azospirillum canadense]